MNLGEKAALTITITFAREKIAEGFQKAFEKKDFPFAGDLKAKSNGATVTITPAIKKDLLKGLIGGMIRARQLAKRTVSMSNLRHIAMIVALYENEYDVFPPSLLSLVPEFMSGEMLFSPVSKRKPKFDEKGLPIGPLDYILIFLPLTETIPEPGKIIRVYEKPENYKLKGTNVAYADGHVKWVTMEKFKADMQRTQEFLAKQANGK